MRDAWEDDPGHEEEGVNAFRKRVRRRGDRVARSGLMTALGLLVLIAVLSAIWVAHIQGRIHKFTTTTEAPESATTPLARPGGQDVVRLQRMERVGIMVPEFSSMTLLPGDGMLVSQVVLNLPNGREVSLLLGTGDADLAKAQDAVQGAPFHVTLEGRDTSHTPAPEELVARHPSISENNEVLPDGTRAIAHFSADRSSPSAKDGGGAIESAVTATMTGRALDLTVSAKNTGSTPREVEISWQPRFLAPESGLHALSLAPPVQQTAFTSGPGKTGTVRVSLGESDIDLTYTGLKHTYLSAGPEVRLRNEADGYTLHMTAMTPNVRSLHVQSAKNGDSVLVAFSTAGASREAARTIVQPGETLHWRVRLEAIPNGAAPASTQP